MTPKADTQMFGRCLEMQIRIPSHVLLFILRNVSTSEINNTTTVKNMNTASAWLCWQR
jgi:hypothetical protein